MPTKTPLRGFFACVRLHSCAAAIALTGAWLIAPAPGRASDAPTPAFAKEGLAFLQKHCIECHGEKMPEGSLSIAAFKDDASLIRERKTWIKMLQRIEAGEMPPERQPRPSKEEIDGFAKLIRGIYDHYDKNAKPDPGRVTVRRLNRTEYNNTIRDLVGIDFNPAEDFPSDDIGHGFDNIGDVLTLSPVLMERYLDAADAIVNRAILVNLPPPPRRYLAGKYLQPNNAQTSQGRFRVLDPASTEPVHAGPFTAAGDYLKLLPNDELVLRANLYAETSSPGPVKVALFLSGKDLKNVSTDAEVDQLLGPGVPAVKPLKILKIFEITAREAAKVEQIEFPIHGIDGIQRAGLALLKPPEGETPAKLHIEHIWSEGPLETRPVSHRRLLALSPGKPKTQQTREVLARFVRRAYRRPPTSAELDRVVKIVETIVAAGQPWEAGMQRAMMAVLVSPKFLFRLELDDRPEAPEPRPLDDFQLASRLSYFLWSSMPDDELLDLAANGQLAANVDSQVRRMLKDDKAKALVENFGLQWLQLQRLKTFAPDPKLFPNFNEPLRESMKQETLLFLGEIVREDRSILDMLDADFTYLNEPLARHYGLADLMPARGRPERKREAGKPVRGEAFVRVSLPDDTRGGLLTQAGILAVTSNPTRTSPVKRGKWILEQVLGDPPPPPPPNVPELVEGDKAALTGSLRQRMEQHRKNPACAQCHARMDPIGFALENYDAIGAWREKDGEFSLETAGALPDGTAFQGPADLKEVLKQRKNQFTRCLTEKLVTYSLGRGIEYYDRPVVDRIQAAVAKGDYKISALITEIVRSEPFRMRRGL